MNPTKNPPTAHSRPRTANPTIPDTPPRMIPRCDTAVEREAITERRSRYNVSSLPNLFGSHRYDESALHFSSGSSDDPPCWGRSPPRTFGRIGVRPGPGGAGKAYRTLPVTAGIDPTNIILVFAVVHSAAVLPSGNSLPTLTESNSSPKQPELTAFRRCSGVNLSIQPVYGGSPVPLASMNVEISECCWIGEGSRRHPDTRFLIHSVMTGDDYESSLIQLLGTDVSGPISKISEDESVSTLTVLKEQEGEAVIQVRTRPSVLIETFGWANASITFPFAIVDGVATLEVLTPNRGLSKLRDRLDGLDVDYTVNRIHDQIEIGGSLSDRQLRLVRAAVEHGYYDTPRDCTLTDLADELDLAASTVSIILHRAEETMVKQFLEQAISGRPIART